MATGFPDINVLWEINAIICNIFPLVVVTKQPVKISDEDSNERFSRNTPINLIFAAHLQDFLFRYISPYYHAFRYIGIFGSIAIVSVLVQ